MVFRLLGTGNFVSEFSPSGQLRNYPLEHIERRIIGEQEILNLSTIFNRLFC